MPRTFVHAPFLEPSFVDTYAIHEFVKLAIQPKPPWGLPHDGLDLGLN